MSSIFVLQVILRFCFQTILSSGNTHKDCIFCELDMGSDKTFIS